MDEAVYKIMEFTSLCNTDQYPKPERTFEQALEFLKESGDYPDNSNVHNAKDDARFNMNLHSFLLNTMAFYRKAVEEAYIKKAKTTGTSFYIRPNQKL